MNKKVSQSLISYPRNMTGYGKDSIHPNWPNKARIAVQFVLNYEEGERTLFFMETMLLKLSFRKSLAQRHMKVQDI